ncbi:MAG: DHH family phosphoesterase [Candidatus Nezhaarchaeales archaeon]
MIIPLLSRHAQELQELLKNFKRIAVIHHWDSDGLASAALIGRYLSKFNVDTSFHIPKIGIYAIEAINLSEIKEQEPEALLILDYGIPVSHIEKLESLLGVDVIVVDHHINDVRSKSFFNPIAEGLSEDEYPSTTWVLRDLIDVEDSLDLVALGVVGDLGKRLEDKALKGIIEGFISKFGLALDDIYEASNLVDSCYRLLDYSSIHYARRLLEDRGVEGVLRSPILDEKLLELKDEVDRALHSLKLIENGRSIKIFELATKSYITSLIGRELAHKFKNSIIMLIHEVKGLGLTYIYVRSLKFNLRGVLEALRKDQSMNIGGKDKVFVVTCPANCKDHVMLIYDKLIELIGDVG